MKINSYQLQSEIFDAVQAGTSKKDLWDNLRGRRQELKHLCAGGNPSLDEYRVEMSSVGSAIRKQLEESKDQGRLAERSIELRFDAIRLAGQISAAVMSLDPGNSTDADDIRDSYQRLQSAPTQDALRDCDLLLDGAYTDALDTLYGKKEVKAADAKDVT